ncbi:hypothetical protein NSTC731_01246 [Nostoc sp. DSM 114167]|jgi:hypothetical protein
MPNWSIIPIIHLIKREFDKPFFDLSPNPSPTRRGEPKPYFWLLLPFPVGEGGCPGEVHRTHVDLDNFKKHIVIIDLEFQSC